MVGAGDAADKEFLPTLAAHVGVVDTAGDGSCGFIEAHNAANGAVVGIIYFATGDAAGEGAVFYRAIVVPHNAAHPGIACIIRSHGDVDV